MSHDLDDDLDLDAVLPTPPRVSYVMGGSTLEAMAEALPEGGYLTITRDDDYGYILHGSELAVFHPGAPTVREAVAIAVPCKADMGDPA